MATLKPLPKMLLIGAVVGGFGYGLMQMLPKSEVTPVPSIPVVNVQPLPPQAPAPVTQVQEPVAAPEPKATVSNGGAGLDAVLKAGQK